MVIKKTLGEKIFDTANVLIMLLLVVVCVYPILYVLFASLSDSSRLLAKSGILLKPLGFNFEAYKMVFKNPDIVRGYSNTIYIVVIGVFLNIIVTALGAYVLSRKDLYFKGILMKLITFTMFFSGGLIPMYLTVRDLGLLDNRLALIIPGLISTYNLIIMRTSFMAIPDSLEESAKLDGANDFTILFRIILPLSKPVIAVMVLYYGVAHWNAWFNAMIFLRDRSLYPLQLILREILINNSTEKMATNAAISDFAEIGESIKYATIMVATLPILAIYPFIQRYFVKGVMIGALKG